MAESTITIDDGKVKTGFEAISQGLASFDKSMDKVLAIRSNMALGENMDESQYEDPEMARKLMMVGLTKEAENLRKKNPDEPVSAVMWAMERFAKDPSDKNAMLVDSAKRNYEYFKNLESNLKIREIMAASHGRGGGGGGGGMKEKDFATEQSTLGQLVNLSPALLQDLHKAEAAYTADIEKNQPTGFVRGLLNKVGSVLPDGWVDGGPNVSNSDSKAYITNRKNKLELEKAAIIQKHMNPSGVAGSGNLQGFNAVSSSIAAMHALDTAEGYYVGEDGRINRSIKNPEQYGERMKNIVTAKVGETKISQKKSVATTSKGLEMEQQHYGNVLNQYYKTVDQPEIQQPTEAQREVASKKIKSPDEAAYTIYNDPKFKPLIDAVSNWEDKGLGKKKGEVDINSIVLYAGSNNIPGWSFDTEKYLRNYFDSTGLGSSSYQINYIKGLKPAKK